MGKQELYHIHKLGNHDRLWHENTQIIVNEDFKNAMYDRYQNYTAAISVSGGKINLYDLILMVRQNGNIKTVDDLLTYSYHISYYGSLFKRETALENYRLLKNNTKPSRLHSIYLTDEKGVESWIKKIGSDSEVFRVEAEGNIFKTSEYFIPKETLTYEEVFGDAFHYWNPNFKKVPDDANEYLLQGSIKVLEKIK